MISLFEPIFYRRYWIPSRVLLAPINTGFAEDGVPTARLVRFHELRSDSSIGISMVGNVAVSNEGLSNQNTLVLQNHGSIAVYRDLADRIRSRGSLPGIQLAYSPSSLEPKRKWVARDRATEIIRLQTIVRSLSRDKIKDVLGYFYNGARLAYEASYDLIQIHCAHGYFLSLLLDPRINTRLDEFSPRGPWLPDFFEMIRKVTEGRLISVRLSGITGISSIESEQNAVISLARLLDECGFDLIDLSAGYYTIDRNLIYPTKTSDTRTFDLAKLIADHVSCLISFAGQASNLDFFASALNQRQLIALGRAFIADADFAKKHKSSRISEIIQCQLCSKCHYFSRGKNNIECGVNPDL